MLFSTSPEDTPLPRRQDQLSRRHRDNEEAIASTAAAAGIRSVRIVAWRDIDGPHAGGSERHAAAVARALAAAGLEVTLRTSSAGGVRSVAPRDGYTAVRSGGRYAVFVKVPLEELLRRRFGLTRFDLTRFGVPQLHEPRRPKGEALLEVWNGMPFFSPLWAPHPRAVFIHHVHAELWRSALPLLAGRLGENVESRLAPPLYRNVPICTPSQSSADDIARRLRIPPAHISVTPPGVDAHFFSDGPRSPNPLVVAVGRMVPSKRFDMLVDILVEVRDRHPGLEAVIVGDGKERAGLQAHIQARHAAGWCRVVGRISEADLVSLYRRAWVLASASAREGWGMTISEAAASATPAVATRIPGHLDSVEDGVTGLLGSSPRELLQGLDRLLRDGSLRARMGAAAREKALGLSWASTALGLLRAIASDSAGHRR